MYFYYEKNCGAIEYNPDDFKISSFKKSLQNVYANMDIWTI